MTELKIVKTEIFDQNRIEKILKNNSFSNTWLNRLKNYHHNRINGNKIDVIYQLSPNCQKYNLGRLYIKNFKGLQSYPFDIRNPLLEENYIDLDFVNMHPSLLVKIGTDLGFNVKTLKEYVENREVCLKLISSDRILAKKAILKSTYGGCYSLYDNLYDENNDSELININSNMDFLKNIEKEATQIMEYYWLKYKKYHSLVSKKNRPKWSLFALILQTKERECLLLLDDFLKQNGRQMDILIHDGGAVRKIHKDEKTLPDELLRNAEKYIFDKTGFNLKLAIKPYIHSFMDDSSQKIIEMDHILAGEFFVKLLNDKIQRENDDIYFFNDINGLWETGDVPYRMAISKYKNELKFNISSKKILDYGGSNEQNIIILKKWLLPALKKDSLKSNKFISDNIDTSRGMLLFKNGIFSFEFGFNIGFNSKIVFLKQINRNFPIVRNEELINIINEIIFISAFNDNNDGLLVGDYLKKTITMGIYGDYRKKKFYIGLGQSNCGKSMLVNALRQSFGDYITEWDANNILYNKHNTQDEAKRLSWIKDFMGARIAFSNELRLDNTEIDSNLVKTLSSGGDEMRIRGNYENQQHFINRTTLFLMGNDLCPFAPIDSGINSRVRFIRYRLHFTLNPKEKDERLADPSIKDKFTTDDYKNALFFIIWDCYKNMKNEEKILGGTIFEPNSVKEDTNEWIDDETNIFISKLNELYEITHSMNDKIETSLIINYLNNICQLRLSNQKIGRMLSKIIKTDIKDKLINGKKYRFGIKLRITNIIDELN
jgi:hypothetical protein